MLINSSEISLPSAAAREFLSTSCDSEESEVAAVVWIVSNKPERSWRTTEEGSL